MELILVKDVENLGFADDIVTVKNGYGRNYLIPNGAAKLATVSAKKVLAENLKQKAHKEAVVIEEAKSNADKIKALEVKIAAKKGEGNKLFGSVNNINVAEALANEGFDIDKKYITISSGNVKSLGNYIAKVRLHREVVLDLPFEVIELK